MKQKIKRFFYGLAVVVLLIQFIPNNLAIEENYSKNNIMFAYEYEPKIDHILINHCMDCHSNKMEKPWYYKIKPLTFWLNKHTKEAREHLNFDDWALMDKKEKNHNIQECIEEIEDGEMPLASYEIIHSKLSFSKKEELLNWFKKIQD